jgi:hypothetical protein
MRRPNNWQNPCSIAAVALKTPLAQFVTSDIVSNTVYLACVWNSASKVQTLRQLLRRENLVCSGLTSYCHFNAALFSLSFHLRFPFTCNLILLSRAGNVH